MIQLYWNCFILLVRIKARLIALKAHLIREIRTRSSKLSALVYLNYKTQSS